MYVYVCRCELRDYIYFNPINKDYNTEFKRFSLISYCYISSVYFKIIILQKSPFK